ncbi:restriction endonuclease subunit S [Corynebacterium glutamicum]|uniref:restriction endonuclease subunit S n=1 Tax=Corynebacterium glutamicum TaxID=1718 RepID=UPI000944A1A7|nr:restriction endonuclease subunit S [Corynebacterium glutamicum]OKX84266.1 restriction endonuclease subunit S [Corynebacterium glutamicum]
MSRIDDLIAEHCPEGVEFRLLSSLGKRNKGTPITAAKMKILALTPGPIRVFAGGQTIADVSEDAIPSKNIVRVPSIIVKSRGNIGLSYYEKPFTHKSELWSYSIDDPEVDQKFVYYYLLTQVPRLQEVARATSVKLPQLGVKDTDFLRIPVPPLTVQRAIVEILDNFTALEAELEAELEARKKQYEYYRHQMLVFGAEVQEAPLGDLAINLDRKRKPVTRDARTSGDIPYYGASGIVDYVSDYIFDGDYLLVSEDGANLLARTTPIAFSISGKTWVNNHAHVLEFATYVERRFVEIYLNSIDLTPYISGAAQPKLNKANLNRIPIPNPSIEEKERVVEVLDKFDALVNDLSSGLPAEITARRKQYEYYRDQLLTFKELAS